MRLGKAGCCVDETGQFHDAPHKVQIARMRVQGGEQINRNRASRFSCHVCAEFTGPQPAVFLRYGRTDTQARRFERSSNKRPPAAPRRQFNIEALQGGVNRHGSVLLRSRAFFSELAQEASAKTVWRSMRAEQVSIA